jgi:hypothetical protein
MAEEAKQMEATKEINPEEILNFLKPKIGAKSRRDPEFSKAQNWRPI